MEAFPSRFLLIVFIISSVAFFTTSRAEDEHSYSYGDKEEKGPHKWGEIKPEWGVCNTGKLQSPIDMRNDRVKELPSLGALKTDYKSAPATVKSRGHDVALEWKDGNAGGVTINGTVYNLVNIHWHSPSEHTVNGKSFALEGHMVHQSADKSLAVIGILYESGKANPFLAQVLSKAKDINEHGTDVGSVHPDDINFNKEEYYRYMGSLTTPPCTEGVLWTVVKKVDTVSKKQINALQDAVHDGFEHNARPVQVVNGRPINSS